MTVTPAGSRSGSPGGATTATWWRTRFRTPSSRSGRNRRGFRGDGDIAAWLWGIAIRRLVSRLRARGGVAAVSGHAEVAPAAEDQVLLSVEYGDIGQALARLSPEMRAVGFVAVVLAASTWVSPLRSAIAVSSAWLAVIWLLAARAGSPDAVLQGRAQAAFLALAAASFAIFVVRRRRLRQLRPWR